MGRVGDARAALDGRVVAAVALACGLFPGCELWEHDELASGSSPDTTPDVSITFEGGVDDDGSATIATSGDDVGLPSLQPPADALVLRVSGGLDPGSGHSWDLHAVVARDAVMAGESMRLTISRSLALDVGEALIRFQSGHGEDRETASHGAVFLTIDVCARTVEGDAQVAPEDLAATFRGEVALSEDVVCPSDDAG